MNAQELTDAQLAAIEDARNDLNRAMRAVAVDAEHEHLIALLDAWVNRRTQEPRP